MSFLRRFADASVTTLTDAATIAVDVATGPNFQVTLAGNRTLGNPTNSTATKEIWLTVAQDGTGGRTLAFGADWIAVDATTAINTAVNAVSLIYALARDFGGGVKWYYTVEHAAESGGSSLTVQDEGSTLSTAVTSVNFVGAGVTATGTSAVTVTIPSNSLTVQDEGSTLSAAVTSVNFVGAGVTATGTSAVTVTIPAGGVTGTGTTNTVPVWSGASSIANSNAAAGTVLLAGTDAATGGILSLRGGASSTAGIAGGAFNITGGAGGGTTGAGGAVTIAGGPGGASSGAGGNVTISGGSNNSTSPGSVAITAGSTTTAFFQGGNVAITAGDGGHVSVGTGGGSISITAGNGLGGSNSLGGNVTITAGAGGSREGGNITVLGGLGTQNLRGGNITIRPGTTTGSTFTPAMLTLSGAIGGATGGDGGDITIQGGSPAANSGLGGSIFVYGGDATFGVSGGNNGGNVYLRGGKRNDTFSTEGSVYLLQNSVGSATRLSFAQGTAPLGTAPSAAVSIFAPAAVTAYSLTLPGTQGAASTFLQNNGSGVLSWAAAGTGTVTSASVVSANGFAGTVATATTTPAITLTTSITGVIKGNGTALSAAVLGTDYVGGPSATSTDNAIATWNGSVAAALRNNTLTISGQTLSTPAASAGNAVNITAGAGSTTTGGNLVLTGGAATSGLGGAVNLTAGASSGTSAGGNVALFATDGVGTNQAGGTLQLRPGASTGTGVDGNIRVVTPGSKAVRLSFEQGTAPSTAEPTTSVSLTAPAAVTAHTLILPGTIGTANQALVINSVSGTQASLGWVTQQLLNITTDANTTRSITTADEFKTFQMTHASGCTVTVPKDATSNCTVGCVIELIQMTASQVTVTPEDGAIVIRSSGNLLKTSSQYASIFLKKLSSNVWQLTGDRSA